MLFLGIHNWAGAGEGHRSVRDRAGPWAVGVSSLWGRNYLIFRPLSLGSGCVVPAGGWLNASFWAGQGEQCQPWEVRSPLSMWFHRKEGTFTHTCVYVLYFMRLKTMRDYLSRHVLTLKCNLSRSSNFKLWRIPLKNLLVLPIWFSCDGCSEPLSLLWPRSTHFLITQLPAFALMPVLDEEEEGGGDSSRTRATNPPIRMIRFHLRPWTWVMSWMSQWCHWMSIYCVWDTCWVCHSSPLTFQ